MRGVCANHAVTLAVPRHEETPAAPRGARTAVARRVAARRAVPRQQRHGAATTIAAELARWQCAAPVAAALARREAAELPSTGFVAACVRSCARSAQCKKMQAL